MNWLETQEKSNVEKGGKRQVELIAIRGRNERVPGLSVEVIVNGFRIRVAGDYRQIKAIGQSR